MPAFPLFRLQGDTSLLVFLGNVVDPGISARVRALAAKLQQSPLPGVREINPAYTCVQIQSDPRVLSPRETQAWVKEELNLLGSAVAEEVRLVEVPVVYGGEAGPDLERVAQLTGLSPEEVISLHSAVDYCCYLVGFTPGFPYLGGLSPKLTLPRLATPRVDVPMGSVGIAGNQSGTYALGGPGGWNLLGRTPLLLYDPRRAPPTLIRGGDKVRFLPQKEGEFPILPPGETPSAAREDAVLRALNPGALTTVQDEGRWGYQAQGVPVSGALDRFSLALANRLVNNPPDAAALELTLLGPKLKVLRDITVAVCGADLGFRLDGQSVPMGQGLALKAGQILDFTGPRNGARAILAVSGGIETPVILGSRSTYHLGRMGGALRSGQLLAAGRAGEPQLLKAPPELLPQAKLPLPLRVIPGPNQDFFTGKSYQTLFASAYEITQRSDRRGIRLAGPKLDLSAGGPTSIISEPNSPGIVQVPPDGSPIILLNEQTVGGYAKIATVISADLPALARAMPGHKVHFAPVSLDEALQAARAQAQALSSLGG